jgi:hypothetical protein
MKPSKRLLATCLAAGLAGILTTAACGDDGGNNPDRDSGSGPDATPDAWAGPTRSMAILVAHVDVTTPSAAASGVRGGVVSIELQDLTSGGGERIYGTNSDAGCVVDRYDANGGPSTPHPTLAFGTVTLSNPNQFPGLRKPVGPCVFQGGAYQCVSHAGTAHGVTVTPAGQGSASYVLIDQNFAGIDLVGGHLVVDGLSVASNNSGPRGFPIVSQAGPDWNILVVMNPDAGLEQAGGGTDDVAFEIRNGAGPVPTQAGEATNFLGDGQTSVRVEKAAHGEWGAVDFTTTVRGLNLRLAGDSTLPHGLPRTAEAALFRCADACGAEVEMPHQVLIVSGRTTDGATAGLADDVMPEARTAYTTFECAFEGRTEGTIPEAAMAAILSTDPTRIETRVLAVAGGQVTDGDNLGSILVGHGLIGHTDVGSP